MEQSIARLPLTDERDPDALIRRLVAVLRDSPAPPYEARLLTSDGTVHRFNLMYHDPLEFRAEIVASDPSRWVSLAVLPYWYGGSAALLHFPFNLAIGIGIGGQAFLDRWQQGEAFLPDIEPVTPEVACWLERYAGPHFTDLSLLPSLP